MRMFGDLEQRLEAGQHLARHRPRQIGQQVVAERLDLRGRQVRQLEPTKPRGDVQVDVLSVLPDRGALPAVRLDALDPAFRSLGNGRTLGWGCVDALVEIDFDRRVMGVGILLALECLDVAVAVLVRVIDYPGFLRLALPGRPSALAYRHSPSCGRRHRFGRGFLAFSASASAFSTAARMNATRDGPGSNRASIWSICPRAENIGPHV